MIRPVALLLLPAFALAGCSSWSMPTMPSMDSLPSLPSLPSWPTWSSIKPYTLDIQQGIVIDSEMIGRLKDGMTRTQVGYVLGTPLLADPFHANRWDYVYYTRKGGKLSQPHNLTVFFKDDKLQRFETDYALPPPATAAVTPAPAPGQQAKPPAPGSATTPATVPVPVETH